MIKFTISGRLPSLNDYINVCRHNKYKAATFKKRIDTQIISEIRKQRIGKAKTPVYIEFLWVEKDRRRDLDNIYSGKKYILDALQTAGVIPNDSQKYVMGLVDTVAFVRCSIFARSARESGGWLAIASRTRARFMSRIYS